MIRTAPEVGRRTRCGAFAVAARNIGLAYLDAGLVVLDVVSEVTGFIERQLNEAAVRFGPLR